jgi:glycosyltransferase involved in cell wall biosynthesis
MNIKYFHMDMRAMSNNSTEARTIHIMETVGALRSLGHQVDCFLGGEINMGERSLRQRSQEVSQKNRLYRLVKPLLRDLYELYQNTRNMNFVKSILSENNIDFVYERWAENQSGVSAYTQKYSIPLIVESNMPPEERRDYWREPLYPVSKRIHKTVLQRADAVTVMSTPLKDYYDKMGINRKKIFVLPNGVNDKRFSELNVSRNLRLELGIDDKLVVGFVGNIHPFHGIGLFLPLARTCSLSFNDLHFMIVGTGQGRDELRSSLEQEQLSDWFTFVDPVPNVEIPNYIAAMDICILPQFSWYGSPMKILEYGAMGKAIVAPDQVNIRDVLTHGENAFLFESDKPEALANAVEEVAKDKDLRGRLGLAAQEHILANHTWTRNAQRIIDIYQYITS